MGQLGDGTTVYRYLPVPVTGISGVIAASGGDYHSLALKSDGTPWSWGYNAYGQLGTGDPYSRYTPVPVSNLTSVTDMAAAISHSVAVVSNGTVWAWGLNDLGERHGLGLGAQ
jgi:alpha-tubulin suppressor-like RCC1 family protein